MRCSRSTMGSSKYEESNGSLICESVTQSEKVVVPLFVLSFSPCVWTQGLPNLAKLHSHAYPPNGSPLQIISTNQWSHTWSYPRTTISLLITDRIETRLEFFFVHGSFINLSQIYLHTRSIDRPQPQYRSNFYIQRIIILTDSPLWTIHNTRRTKYKSCA